MTVVEKLPTGIPGFDTISHGGIPKGRSSLIVGRAGTGKTIVGLQIAANLARIGVKTILLAVEESPEDMQDERRRLGLGISRLIDEGKLPIADATRPMDGADDRQRRLRPVRPGPPHRRRWSQQTGAEALVLDSATALFSPRPPDRPAAQPLLPARARACAASGLTRGHARGGAARLRPADHAGRRGLRLRPASSSCATSSTATAAAARSRSTSTAAARTTRASTPARSRRAGSPSFRSTPRSIRSRTASSATRAASTGSTR